MAWTNTEDVRLLTGLDDYDIEDDDLELLLDVAQKEVLLKINNRIVREEIKLIDETRTNSIDGDNTTYYIRNWKGNFISDNNFDLDITVADVEVISVDGDGLETIETVSSISSSEGKFVLATAPLDVDLYVSYSFSYHDPETPNPLLKLATEYLAGAYSYMRINSSQNKQVKFGNVSISNGIGNNSSYLFLYNKYLDIMRQLDENIGRGAIWGTSKVII